MLNLEFAAHDSGFRIAGLGFRTWGFGIWDAQATQPEP